MEPFTEQMKLFKRNQVKVDQSLKSGNFDEEYQIEETKNRSVSSISRGINSSNASSVDLDTQMVLMKTFENFYDQESEAMITVLEQSREDIKNSMLDLFYEQEQFKEELNKASEGKYNFKRKKENSIPLAEYLRRKRGASRNIDSETPNDKAITEGEKEAVEKYMRKKERQKQAQENRLNREINEQSIEAETQKIINKLNGIDLNKEKERQRQVEKIQTKLMHKPKHKDNEEIATEIMDKYQDTKIAYERGKQMQKEKFEARLSARRGDSRDVTNSKYFTTRNANTKF